jgi:hypothetical protein
MSANHLTGASRLRETTVMGGSRLDRVRERLEAMRARSEKSTSWRSLTPYFTRLVNREGYVPVRARLSREDLGFLGSARDDMVALCEMALRLLELHQPCDAGGISSDPENPSLRCRACMWRWPCPTFRAVERATDRPS